MSGTKDFDRVLLPRWLNSNSAVVSGSIKNAPLISERTSDQFHYISLEREWNSSKEIYSAIELVSAAMLYGDWDSSSAIQAARSIVSTESLARYQRELAASFLRGDCVVVPDVSLESEEDPGAAIGRLRKYLSDNSMDALAWLDLSYYYALASSERDSLRSILVAAELARGTPFIVRSAARAFLHFGDSEKALRILRGAFSETGNYAFAVSEMAISQQCRLASKLEDRIFRQFSTPSRRVFSSGVWSEIGAVVATKESVSGAHKKAKKAAVSVLPHISNENVLAQLEWLSSRENFTIGQRPLFSADYEADAIAAYNSGKLHAAVQHCLDWARFQPFSSAPGMHGSYVASVALADFALAEKLSAYAYRFSGDEFLSINNYAFALAANDRAEEALGILRDISPAQLDSRDALTFLATSGFVCYKIGEIELGRESYRKALDGFKKSKNMKSYAIAAHFWMMVDGDMRNSSLDEEVKKISKSENIIEIKYYNENRLSSPEGKSPA